MSGKNRKIALCIAGFDPSGGAGILADVKTLESNKITAIGIISSNTLQHDLSFDSVEWIPLEALKNQINFLYKRFEFEYVKIGLIQSMEVLLALQEFLLAINKNIKVILDPIGASGTGHIFHAMKEFPQIENILRNAFIITPNIPEAESLGPHLAAEENAVWMSQFCHVYLKGGHSSARPGYDKLFLRNGKSFSFASKICDVAEKHGSGCVFSSALTANLVKGETLHYSSLKAKGYTARFLKSNSTRLGFHKL